MHLHEYMIMNGLNEAEALKFVIINNTKHIKQTDFSW